jgi:polyisoprenoid-binding protein YceI
MSVANVRAFRAALPFVAVLLSACGPSATQVSPTTAPAPPTLAPKPTTAPAATAAPAQPTAAAAAPAQPTYAAASTTETKPTSKSEPAAAAAPAGTVRLNLVADGTKARFRAREQLARLPAPSEAIGTTSDVNGSIGVGPNGIVPEASKISVKLDSLASDSSMRDRFIKQSTLQTQRFPTAEFQPREASGLPWPLPTSGELSFQLTGDLNIHGVAQPKTWDIKAQFGPGEVNGSGSTSVTLEQFGMEKPRVASVLSIEDTIVLEIDFKATP